METKDLSLTFIDHVEKKIQSPDREKFDKSRPGFSGIKDIVEEINDKNDDKKIEKSDDGNKHSIEGGQAEHSVDRSESFLGTNVPDHDSPRRSEETKAPEGTEQLSNVDTFTYSYNFYNLNEDEIASLNTQSSIDSENRVAVEKISDDSGFVDEKKTTTTVEDSKERTSAPSSEMREVHSSSQRDGIFEFTSHTSNMLQFEKSRKMEHSVGRKRKELSPLTIEDDTTGVDGSSVGEVGLEVKESVPQQCSEDIQVSETRQDEQPMSPTTFTRDSKQHLIFEEDEENVIIHLETEFEQEDDTAMKEAQTAEISLAEKPSLQSEKKALDIGGLDTVPGSAVSNPIEVERKFTVTADTKIRLLELGAELRKEKTFKDAYYDNSDYRLTLSDCWLRQRNGTWEFKVAVSSFIKPSSSTQYSEITDENEICRLLHRKFDVKDDVVRTMSLNELIDKLKLDVFAKFTTTRQTYFLPECTIDLDLADFGFQVGEIEVMIADEKRIPEALQTIDSVASKLGLVDKEQMGGKISAYLFQHNVKMYDHLLKLNAITPTLGGAEPGKETLKGEDHRTKEEER